MRCPRFGPVGPFGPLGKHGALPHRFTGHVPSDEHVSPPTDTPLCQTLHMTLFCSISNPTVWRSDIILHIIPYHIVSNGTVFGVVRYHIGTTGALTSPMTPSVSTARMVLWERRGLSVHTPTSMTCITYKRKPFGTTITIIIWMQLECGPPRDHLVRYNII